MSQPSFRPSGARGSRFGTLAAGAAVFLAAMAASSSFALVDDAHSYAMEAATPYVEEGFKVRSDYWSGDVKSGEKKAIRHQLFKGNDYCFWLGTSMDGASLTIGIYDLEGNPLEIIVVEGNNAKSARIDPPRTGSYLIVFSVTTPEDVPADESVHWALAYGYR